MAKGKTPADPSRHHPAPVMRSKTDSKNGDFDKPNAKDGESRSNKTIAVATVFIAAATIATVVVAGLQLCALWQADETTRTVNRAFVVVDEILWMPAEKDGAPAWRILPKWMNSGNTSTENLQIETSCPNSRIAVDDPTKTGAKKVTMFRSLGPKQSTLGGTCTFKTSDLIKVQQGNVHLYVFTKATYQDDFGTPHVTEVCIRYAAIFGDLNNPAAFPTRAHDLCATHNCTDRECAKSQDTGQPQPP